MINNKNYNLSYITKIKTKKPINNQNTCYSTKINVNNLITHDENDNNISKNDELIKNNEKCISENELLLLKINNKQKELNDIINEIDNKNHTLKKLSFTIKNKQKYLYELLININNYDNINCNNIIYDDKLNDIQHTIKNTKIKPLISVITVIQNENEIINIINMLSINNINLNLEHILINVSKNNYVELIKKYTEKTNYIINYLDIGSKFTVIDGLNTGILKSNGNFITFMKLSSLFNSNAINILPYYLNYENVIISGSYNNNNLRKNNKIINKQLFMNNLDVNINAIIFSKNIINSSNLLNNNYQYTYLYNFCINNIFNDIKYIIDNRIKCEFDQNYNNENTIIEQIINIKVYYDIVHKKLISILIDKLYPDLCKDINGDIKKFILYKYIKNLQINDDSDIQKIVVDILNKINDDKYKNTDILVIGNGPSTKQLEFNKIHNIDTIGMNAAYRYWKKINWYPTYYACLDDKVIVSHAEEIYNLIMFSPIELFFLHDNIKDIYDDLENNDKVLFLSDVYKNINPINSKLSDYDIFNSTYLTTGAFSIRLMMLLGYKNIYTIGIDCNYTNIIECSILVDKIKMTIEQEPLKNPNYFFNDYQKKGDIYNIPNPAGYENIHLDAINAIYDYVKKNNVAINIYKLSNINKNINFEYYESMEKIIMT
jgi:hypothetical protein